MSIRFEERLSDSPYIDTIMQGRTESAGQSIRPAEPSWHMVFTRHSGRMHPLIVGPWSSSGVVSYGEGGEILWIRFKLGAYMPHLPTKDFRDSETLLPGAAGQSFWLKGSAWQFPDYENVETFIDRLVREDILVCDPVVTAVLREQPQAVAPRTVRHRFLHATGLTQNDIRQIERAQRAAALLRQGVTILDAVYEAGYFDQPHLTRAIRRWIGHTPAQIIRMSQPVCHSVQDGALMPEYATDVLGSVDIEPLTLNPSPTQAGRGT